MAENSVNKNRQKNELILLIFVLISMGIIILELFGNIFAYLVGA
jgi:hypothetical protein